MIRVEHHGSIARLVPTTPQAHTWLARNAVFEPWQYQDGGIVVDARAAEALIERAAKYRERMPARWRRAQRVYTVGGYTATLRKIPDHEMPRFRDDFTLRWDIADQDGVAVGSLFEDRAYGWGRVRYSLTKLVWSGPLPKGVSDPRSEHYGMAFDGGPFDGHETALRAFVQAAERLKAWRRSQS